MAAQNEELERLITILVTPFTTCSAFPVYAIIIALVIPDTRVLGIFNLQGNFNAIVSLGFEWQYFRLMS
jgi:ferrous iron transport protein B